MLNIGTRLHGLRCDGTRALGKRIQHLQTAQRRRTEQQGDKQKSEQQRTAEGKSFHRQANSGLIKGQHTVTSRSKVRYGKMLIEEGGQISGEIRSLAEEEPTAIRPRPEILASVKTATG